MINHSAFFENPSSFLRNSNQTVCNRYLKWCVILFHLFSNVYFSIMQRKYFKRILQISIKSENVSTKFCAVFKKYYIKYSSLEVFCFISYRNKTNNQFCQINKIYKCICFILRFFAHYNISMLIFSLIISESSKAVVFNLQKSYQYFITPLAMKIMNDSGDYNS